MADLIAPHGGLSEPVCRTVDEEGVSDFIAPAARLTRVPVSDADAHRRSIVGATEH